MSALAGLLARFRDYLVGCDDPTVVRFIDGFDWALAERDIAPRSLPVEAYAAAATSPGAEGGVLAALSRASGDLGWGQTYTSGDFGPVFMQRYGWVELFGTRGHFRSDAMAGGFLVLGPEIVYPDHHHIAEEIYIPLTSGSFWSKDGGDFRARGAGEVIHHPSDVRHAMRTEGDALVALYLWRGGPLAQRPEIDGRHIGG